MISAPRSAVVVLLVVLSALWAAPAAAQSATLAGTVRDAETNAPLPLANVVVAGTERGATTDDQGRFVIDDLAPDSYTLVVSYVGFETVRRTVALDAGEGRTVSVSLQPLEMDLRELTVTGERVESQDLGATRITPQDVKTLPAVLEPDLFRALQLLPGVKSSSDFSSGLYIRGGSPDQTLVLLDAAPIYNPTHVFGFFSTFHPDAIGDVTLYKGGYPAQYGGRLSGVVDVSTKRPSTAETKGGLSLGLLSARANAQGGFGAEGDPSRTGRWMVSARRSTLEPLLSGLNRAGVDDIPTGFYFYDLNAAASYDLTATDRLSLALYNGRDQLDYPFLVDAVFDVGYGNRSATLDWRHRFGSGRSMRWTAAASHYHSDPTAQFAGTAFVRDTDVLDLRLQGDATWTLTDRHVLRGGTTVGRFASDVDNFFDGQRTYSPSATSYRASTYLQDTYQPAWAPNVTVTAGLRASYFERGDYFRLSPRVSVDYQLTDPVQLQAGYGRYQQYLTAATSELFSAFDFWLTTADQVPPAYGDQFLVGVKTQPAPHLRFDAEAYYRTMRRLFEFDRLRPDYNGLDEADVFQYGSGEAYGLETALRRTKGRITGSVAYTLSRTTRTFEALSETAFTPRYDRTHDITAVLNVDLAENWRVTTVFTYATGQPYTEPTGYFKTLDDPFLNGARTPFQATYNNARLPAYHRLDVGLRKKGTVFGVDYEGRVQLVNAYARRNIWFVLFEPTDDSQIERTVVPQIPVPLPNLSLTLSF